MAEKNEKNYNRDDIMKLFKRLAQSQGFYGRLINSIEDATEEAREAFWQEMESREFKSDLDVILAIEC